MFSENFDKDFHRYAELLATHGLNVQPDQWVNISTEIINRDFALLIAEKCYERGARYVSVRFEDPRLHKMRVEHSADESLSFVPKSEQSHYDQLVDLNAANLRLIGMEFPDLMSGTDAGKVNTIQKHVQVAMERFRKEGIGKSQAHWTVAAAATPGWGKQLYPELEPEAACDALWQDILQICRADKPACMDLWREHNDVLQKRATILTERKLKEIRFVGPGTDLRVGLHERAVWQGGQDTGPHGEPFEPNIPTEEVFTTPDYRMTEGHARATRPFMINGVLIENLTMEFKGGVLTDFTASNGAETFAAYIGSDEGASRLGEVALVGIDSPIYQSGKIFNEILFDENAACHIAVGLAYKFCIQDGEELDSAGSDAIGCNESMVHTDMMISSEDVDVTATTYDGEEITIMQGGAWAREFQKPEAPSVLV